MDGWSALDWKAERGKPSGHLIDKPIRQRKEVTLPDGSVLREGAAFCNAPLRGDLSKLDGFVELLVVGAHEPSVARHPIALEASWPRRVHSGLYDPAYSAYISVRVVQNH